MPGELKAVKDAPLREPDIFEFPFETADVVISGKTFSFRELSVEENDKCSDGAREEGGLINGRTMMRLMIITSSVNPKITSKDIGKLPQRVYLKICDAINALNNPDALEGAEGEDEDEKKGT